MKEITLGQNNVLNIINPDKIYIAVVPLLGGAGYFRLERSNARIFWFDQINEPIRYTHLWIGNCVQYACESFLKQPLSGRQLFQFNDEKEFNEWWEYLQALRRLS